MELRLWRDVEVDSGIRHSRWSVTYLYSTESHHIASKGLSANQLNFLSHFHTNGLFLHFGCSLQTLGQCLLREALLIGTVYGIMNVQKVFGHQHCRLRQEREERNLLRFCQSQFRHYLYLLALIFRQLRFHLKGTYRVNVIAKHVDTERKFRTIAIYVKNTASQGKLTWFVHVVNLTESQ